ncbi:MAG: sigma-70 family RNA polymerase sigma factor [Caldilineaceae bacterium]|nr:sigma-70 family RNA polymerase sigma factor [Caldilineaceae bacterium]
MPLASRPNFSQQSDEVLLQLVAQRNLAAYELLYRRHAQVMFNLIARIVHDPAAAEDLLQDVFWQIWENAHQYRGSGAALAWMMRVARNRSLDQLRRQGARPPTVSADAEEVENIADGTTIEETVEMQMRRAQVQRALDSIPEDQRRCLELAYFEGLSQREIAEQTNLAVGTIKSRIRIGLEKVERLLRGSGVRDASG